MSELNISFGLKTETPTSFPIISTSMIQLGFSRSTLLSISRKYEIKVHNLDQLLSVERTLAISSDVIAPSRIILGTRPDRSKIVDALPCLILPPSKTASNPLNEDKITSEIDFEGFSPD